MRVRIYQINMDRDTKHACFMKYETMLRLQEKLDSFVYDLAYEGDVDASDLEEVYEIFNLHHPKDYCGRSLSVSDIVEIVDQEKQESKFYYCDTFGFKEVNFDPAAATDMITDAIEVLLVKPENIPIRYRMKNTLAELRKAVHGSIQAIYPYEDPVALICNENGKIEGLPLNRALCLADGEIYDIISGNFLIVGIEEDHFCGLPEELMEKYRKKFWYPETFSIVNGKIKRIKHQKPVR